MKKTLYIILAALLISFVGCMDTKKDVTLTKITVEVEEGKAVLLEGAQTNIGVKAFYSDGKVENTVADSLTVSNATVASISGKAVKALKAGNVTVTAVKGGKSSTVDILVVAKPTEPEVPSVEIPDGFMRVYFKSDDTSKYVKLGCYAWEDGGQSNILGAWPGTQVTNMSADGMMYIDIKVPSAESKLGVIFNSMGDPKHVEMEPGQDRYVFRTNGGKLIKESWFKDKVNIQYLDKEFKTEAVLPLGIKVAEMVSKNTFRVRLTQAITLTAGAVTIDGLTVTKVEATSDAKVFIVTVAENLAADKNYTITIAGGSAPKNSVISGEFTSSNDFYYAGNDLGATLKNDGTAVLKVWSPLAEKVKVYVYDKDDQNVQVAGPIDLSKGDKGVWSVTLDKVNTKIYNLDGYFYQYEVTAAGQTKRALDPYAKSMAGFSPRGTDLVGKAAIINVKAPKAGNPSVSIGNTTLGSATDMIAYEVHVRDFTINTDVAGKGTFNGFKNFDAGIAHLKELGITHVQLLPVQNFYTVDEKNKDIMMVGDFHNTNYNWGYDPHNYFTPEGWYSSNPDDPYARIKEYRELVKKLHDNGIGVIMDVVFNHTYNNDVFNNVAPGLYYRPAGGSMPVGAPAVASERLMVRKLILDSLKYYVDEFGVDGFRFDLMGFIDSETLKQARTLLGDKIILQGEAWNFTDLNPNLAPVIGVTNYDNHGIKDLAYFNDKGRDNYAPKMGYGESDVSAAYPQGQLANVGTVKGALLGSIGNSKFTNGGEWFFADTGSGTRFAAEPTEALQYVSIHDGYTLWDKVNMQVEGSKTDKILSMNMSNALLFTSQGKVIVHGGDEIARTKPQAINDPESGRTNHKNKEKMLNEGFVIPYSVHENSYKSPDYTNMFRWDRKDTFRPVFDYTKGLVEMRRNIPALRFKSSANIEKGFRFINEKKPDGFIEEKYAGYTSFEDAAFSEVEVEFYFSGTVPEGVKGSTWYLTGEVYSDNLLNADQMASTKVTFSEDDKPIASIKFTKEQISKFNLNRWQDKESLNVKLVKGNGNWDIISGSYEGEGNTKLNPAKILDSNKIRVDLSIPNFAPGELKVEQDVITYWLDNTVEDSSLGAGVTGTSYKQLIVVHNPLTKSAIITTDKVYSHTDWVVLADSDDAGVAPLTYTFGTPAKGETNVKINDKTIVVPAKSSAVIATTLSEVILYNKGLLQTEVDKANALYNAAVEGDGDGNYKVGAKAKLKAVIDSSETLIKSSTATRAQLEEAVTVIKKAITDFEAQKNTGSTTLKIIFINAPADVKGTTAFWVGELPKSVLGDQNPATNKFEVKFDSTGRGELVIKKADIDITDMSAWGEPDALTGKLVKVAGAWDGIGVTGMNNNNIKFINGIKYGTAVVDLSKDPDTESFVGQLAVEFINAPADVKGTTAYWVGELPKSVLGDQNPASNKYQVKFDSEGRGVLVVTKADIEATDLSAWGEPNALTGKLVKTAGAWDGIGVTGMNNNNVNFLNGIKYGTAVIDLSKDPDTESFAGQLAVQFINAPADVKGTTAYWVGELPKSVLGDQNPASNKYQVKFDNTGKGLLIVSKADIEATDMSAWGTPDMLTGKLVKVAGAWDGIGVTGMNNNDISIKSGDAIIDLSKDPDSF